MSEHRVFELGDLVLQSGAVCADARLVYRTHGELAADRANVILYPTAFGGQHPDVEWSIAPAHALDPTRYYVVVVNMFGNGLSTSPSNADDCPGFTIHDNVMAQQRLLTEGLGVERVALVYGRSMGALQAFHWGALFPAMVARICCVCGASRATPHNRLFIQGLRAALTADEAWQDGRFVRPPERGLAAMARVYAGWALSQAFYREETWRQLGYASQEEFVVARWEGFLGRRDPRDILAMLWTWERADVSANARFGGDLGAALAAIRARALVMPSATDLYFPVADNAWEVARMPNAELSPIPSVWGHMAGSWPEDAADVGFIDRAVRELLAA